MDKKAVSHVDWAISMGIFLVYVLSMFVMIQPGMQPFYKENTMIGIAEEQLQLDIYYNITRIPLYIKVYTDPYTEKGKPDHFQVDFPSDYYILGTDDINITFRPDSSSEEHIDFDLAGNSQNIKIAIPAAFSTTEGPPTGAFFHVKLKYACNDGRDNDGDGRVDYPSDLGCSSAFDIDEYNVWLQCEDTIDNDGDDKIDYPSDPGCTSTSDNDEYNLAQCSDKMDNDGDGKTDLRDPSCSAPADNDETNPYQCGDGIDNDGDGRTDTVDLGCTSTSDNDESNSYMCSNGLDDDDDELTDTEDPGCDSQFDDDEYNEAPESTTPVGTYMFWVYYAPDKYGVVKYKSGLGNKYSDSDMDVDFGVPEILEGIDPAKLNDIKQACTNTETYLALKEKWGYPAGKDFAIYYVQSATIPYDLNSKVDICNVATPYDQSNVYVKEWSDWILNPDGTRMPVIFNLRVW